MRGGNFGILELGNWEISSGSKLVAHSWQLKKSKHFCSYTQLIIKSLPHKT